VHAGNEDRKYAITDKELSEYAKPEHLSDDDMPLDLALNDDPNLRLRIGRYLGGVRKLKKISQEQAAKDLSMSRPHLSNIEQGRSRTGWKGLRHMARYYGYGVRALIEEVAAMVPAGQPILTREPPGAAAAPEAELAQTIRDVMPKTPTADDAFLMGLMLLLDAEDRAVIKRQILELVQARIRRAAST
jgi:transcriptional regulator with XRE-family HTH domain